MRLKDIAKSVQRQASIRNDPVFEMQSQRGVSQTKKSPSKTTKGSDSPLKNATVSATSVKDASKRENSLTCAICTSTRHRLQECHIIKQCERAASYRFCFNCGCHNPDHCGTSCPEPPACSLCLGHHLTILHKDNNNGSRVLRDKNTYQQCSSCCPNYPATTNGARHKTDTQRKTTDFNQLCQCQHHKSLSVVKCSSSNHFYRER